MKTLAALLMMTALLAGCSDDGDSAPEAVDPSAETSSATSPPAAPQPVVLTVDTPQPTAEETVTLTGSVDRATHLTFSVIRGDAVVAGAEADAEGPWSIPVPLPDVGESRVEVFTSDADGGAFASVVAVRLGEYTVEVDYGGYPGYEDSQDVVLLDPDALLSAPRYEEQGAEHPGFAIVHDLLLAWQDATGNSVEYSWSAEFGAYSVNRINEAGNPVTSALPPWWCYRVNGERADLGISLQPIAPGDVVAWDLGACA